MARSNPAPRTIPQIVADLRAALPRPHAQFKVTYYDDLTPEQWAANDAEALSMDRYARAVRL